MEYDFLTEKNKHNVKIWSWVIICISAYFILNCLSVVRAEIVLRFFSHLSVFDQNVDIRLPFPAYMVAVKVIKLVIFIPILIYGIQALHFKEQGRSTLITLLYAGMVITLIDPLTQIIFVNGLTIPFPEGFHFLSRIFKTFTYIFTYSGAIIFSVVFFFCIKFFSKEEIKKLFI